MLRIGYGGGRRLLGDSEEHQENTLEILRHVVLWNSYTSDFSCDICRGPPPIADAKHRRS